MSSQLMNKERIENLQVTLACQVTQKNALISAVKLASLCYWAENVASPAEVCVVQRGVNEAHSSNVILEYIHVYLTARVTGLF